MASLLTCVNAFKQSLTGGAFEALAAATKDSLQIVSTGDPNTPAGWIEEAWLPTRLTRWSGTSSPSGSETTRTVYAAS